MGVLFIIFCLNLLIYFKEYKNFIDEEVYQSNATVINIYDKKTYKVLKLKTDRFTVFTSIPSNQNITIYQNINLYFLTSNISFIEYLKGFYTKSFNLTILPYSNTLKNVTNHYILQQHTDKQIASLYSALFLATNIDKELRSIVTHYGVSHLVAISGFHLGVISGILYFLLNIVYKTLHQKYFPYRNKKYDILLFTTLILFSYLIFLDLAPSLLRAFCMFIFALIFARSNIRIISFETLFIVVIIILAIFPKLLFSVSLWLSVIGVFYIFLFIKYFSTLNKYLQIIIFNFWIFLAINPIVHYIFGTTSIDQLYSPLLTLIFTIFYPFAVFIHIVGYGDILDTFFTMIILGSYISYDIITPFYFLIFYIILSLFSINNKYIFYSLNILIIVFNLILYTSC